MAEAPPRKGTAIVVRTDKDTKLHYYAEAGRRGLTLTALVLRALEAYTRQGERRAA